MYLCLIAQSPTELPPTKLSGKGEHMLSVAFCSPSKSLTFSGLMENPLVGKKLKS